MKSLEIAYSLKEKPDYRYIEKRDFYITDKFDKIYMCDVERDASTEMDIFLAEHFSHGEDGVAADIR